MAVPVQKNTFRFRFTAGSIHNRFRFRAGSGSHGPVHSVPVPVRSLTANLGMIHWTLLGAPGRCLGGLPKFT